MKWWAVDRFGDRIRVCHLHDNDGTTDDHEPLSDYQRVVDAVPAEYFAFEMKSIADVARCMNVDYEPIDTAREREQ